MFSTPIAQLFEKGAELRMLELEHALPAAAKAGQTREQHRAAAAPERRKSNNGGD
ncbi:MAG: hypothetical protein U5K56_07065 [Halioglobus sp.]|nr:hypothetical protein [Halioglobus sp.]